MKPGKFATFLLLALVLALASCTRDHKVRAQQYVGHGNTFFDKGKYKEASIMYRRSLQEDRRFGEAYYRLALTDLKLSAYSDEFRNLVRAVELQPANDDAKIKLADLYLSSALRNQRPDIFLESAAGLAGKLLESDPKSFDGHRLMGQIALLKKNSTRALKEFQAANDTKPMQPEVIMPYFQVLAANNRFSEAEKLAYQLMAQKKTYSPIYDLLYAQYLGLNRPADCERVLKLKVENNPRSTAFLLELAGFYIAKQRPEAEAVLRKITDEREHPNGHLIAGDFFFFRLHEFDRARAEYEAGIIAFPQSKSTYQKRLVELDASTGNNSGGKQLLEGVLRDNPRDSEALALRAEVASTGGSRDELNTAARDLQSLVIKEPKNTLLRFNLARVLRTKGDNQGAVLQLEEAIKQRPDFIRARELAAGLYLADGDNPNALKAAGGIIKLDSNNFQAHLIRSSAFLNLGEKAAARGELDLIGKAYPRNVEARYQKGYLDYLEKDYKAAIEIFGTLNLEYPKDHRGLIGIAETLAAENRVNLAIMTIEKAIEVEPKRGDLKFVLATLDVRAGKYNTAIQIFQGLLDTDPNNASLLYNLGESYRQKGDLNEAIENFQLAREIAPNDTKLLLQLALVLDGTGQANACQPIYERILRIQPDNSLALNNLAYLKAENGVDLDQAQTMAERARQQHPNSAEIADTLGWIYLKKNLTTDAARLFEDLVTKEPKSPKFHYHFGLALYQKGDRASAKRELETALEDRPSKRDEAKIRDFLAKH
jgi:tetratricopeptide (TPR) repeat protein